MLEVLFGEPNIRLEDGQLVRVALNENRNLKSVLGNVVDFAVALIINKAKLLANRQNSEFGCCTFDAAAQPLPGAKTLGGYGVYHIGELYALS